MGRGTVELGRDGFVEVHWKLYSGRTARSGEVFQWTKTPNQRRDLETIRRIVSDYARRINAPDVSVFSAPRGDGSPYIEVADDAYYFVIEERGTELHRRRTTDLDELLYWIFDHVTSSLSSDFELRHRKPGEDSRRQLSASTKHFSPSFRPTGENGKPRNTAA
jgi:hypothetical protein